MPWSAVRTIAARSSSPSFRSRSTSRPTTRSVAWSWSRWRCCVSAGRTGSPVHLRLGGDAREAALLVLLDEPAARHDHEREVRQQHVREPEPRTRAAGLDVVHEVGEPPDAVGVDRRAEIVGGGLLPALLAEVAPPRVGVGQAALEVVRQREVAEHDPHVRQQRPEAAARGRPRAPALRAEPRDLLAHLERVGRRQPGEEAVGMVGGDGQQPRSRQPARDDRRDGADRRVRDRSDARVERRHAGEPGEAREPLGVQPPPLVQQRGDGQLVEHDEDHGVGGRVRRRGGRRRAGARLVLREGDPARLVAEEEEPAEQQGRRRERAQQHRDVAYPCARDRDAGADGRGHRHGDRARGAGLRGDEHRDPRREHADEPEVQEPRGARGPQRRERLGPHHRQRRQEREPEGEQDDPGRADVVRDEELRVVPEQRQQRLRDRERPERRELQPVRRPLAQRRPHPRGRTA